MARRKTPEDLEWDQIFNMIQFESEPDPKYIKQAVVETRTGKKFKVSGMEFYEIMAHDRQQPPDQNMVVSCKITLDFERIKTDVTKFAQTHLAKSARRHVKSAHQNRQQRAIKKAPVRPTNKA